jgi:hypothetical protein
MYWYKRSYKSFAFLIICFILLACFQSCSRDSNGVGNNVKFFDLKGYFEAESARLTKINRPVTKTAVHNSSTETKKLYISSWKTELSLFIESDINKPAWKASYRASNSEGITTYTAIDSALKTRYIIIKKQQGKVKLILIYNYKKTTLFGKALYWTTESLSYVPDSMYRIQKTQYVRTLGRNKYFIKGLFNQ